MQYKGAQERIHHFLPVSDFVFADMRAALVAEYSAQLAGESAAADPNPNPNPNPAAQQPALEACGPPALAAAPMAVSLTACAGGEAPRGQLLRQLSPSTPLAVSDDLVMSAAACRRQVLRGVPLRDHVLHLGCGSCRAQHAAGD